MCLLLRSGFCLATHKGLIGGVLQRWLFLPSPQRSSVSDHRVLGHLPDQGPSPPIVSFGQVASSRKSLGGFTLRPLCSWGPSMRQTFFWYPSPDLCLSTILSLSAMDKSFDFMTCFLLGHALPAVEPYTDRCVPFQIMYN